MVCLELKKIPVQLMSQKITVPVCTKAEWDIIRTYDGSDKAARKISGMLLDGIPLNLCDCKLLASVYIEIIARLRKELGLEVPYYPVHRDRATEVKYTAYTVADKLVADYANMSIYDVDKISILEYWLLERDAFIEALSKTEKGRQYLNDAYRITQEDADEDLEL